MAISITNKASSSIPAIVSARYNSSTTAPGSSFGVVAYTTQNFDTNSAYNTSTGTYTVPTAGKYIVHAGLLVDGTYAIGAFSGISIFVNGTEYASKYETMLIATSLGADIFVADTINVSAGDTVQIAVVTTATSATIDASTTRNFFSIARLGS